MKKSLFTAVVVLSGLALACGGGDEATEPAPPAEPAAVEEPAEPEEDPNEEICCEAAGEGEDAESTFSMTKRSACEGEVVDNAKCEGEGEAEAEATEKKTPAAGNRGKAKVGKRGKGN